jgi:protoporphyrinogen/coproporphyrinogen III oxidase
MTTAVVGAGLSGLVRARSLVQHGDDVVLLEESPRAGGVVRTEQRDGFLLELGPNTVRPTAELWSLVEDLGLETEALLADPRLPRYVDFAGRLHALPSSPASMFSTRLLSGRGKRRLLAEPFVPKGDPSGESVRDFFTRRLGPEVAERLVEPFVAGIWAGRSDRLSVADAFPLLARWESESGGLTRGAFAALRNRRRGGPPAKRGLLSFREGLETLPRRLLAELGDRARLATRVESIRRESDRWILATARDELTVDRVCLGTPARDAARLVGRLDADASAALSTIPQPPLVVLHLSIPEKSMLRGFGHLVVPQPERRILGAIWSSSLFPGRAPAGKALVTVFLAGSRDPAAFDLADDELLAAASRDLAAAFGTQTDIELIRVTRYAQAIPQYDLDHRSRIQALLRAEERLPGLTFLGSYRGGVSVGDVVRSAILR